MAVVHFSGPLKFKMSERLAGGPSCVSGKRAEAIAAMGVKAMRRDVSQVTCGRCLMLISMATNPTIADVFR